MNRVKGFGFAGFFLIAISSAALAQVASTPASTPSKLTGSIAGHPGGPVAKAEDVTSPEAIVQAVYSVI